MFALEGDFNRINDVLVGGLQAVQDVLNRLSPLMRLLDDIGGRTDEDLIGFNVKAARQEAWDHAVVLAFQDPAALPVTINVIDRKVAFLGRILGDPGPLFRPALTLIGRTEVHDVGRVVKALGEAPLT